MDRRTLVPKENKWQSHYPVHLLDVFDNGFCGPGEQRKLGQKSGPNISRKKGGERENGSMWWTTEPNPILLDVRSAQDKGKVARDAFTPIYR